MEPENILDQNARTVISAIKKGNFETMELEEILDSENKNRKRNKLIVFLEKIISIIKNKKKTDEPKIENEKEIVKTPKKKIKIIKEKNTVPKNRENIPKNLTFIRKNGEYDEYIDGEISKRYSFVRL